MKLIPMLAVASLFTSAVAFAQTPPPPAPPAPGTTTTTTTTTTTHRHSRHYCRRHADQKNLTGDDRKAYIHACRTGTLPPS